MYHAIIKRLVRRGYEHISRGEFEPVTKLFTSSAVFRFSGDHAMGGERRGPDEVRAWFEFVGRLFRDFRLEPLEIVVDGWPWNTCVAVRFRVHATLPDGAAYGNEGMQFLRLRWGRAVEDFLYEDTQKLAKELERMGASRPAVASA